MERLGINQAIRDFGVDLEAIAVGSGIATTRAATQYSDISEAKNSLIR